MLAPLTIERFTQISSLFITKTRKIKGTDEYGNSHCLNCIMNFYADNNMLGQLAKNLVIPLADLETFVAMHEYRRNYLDGVLPENGPTPEQFARRIKMSPEQFGRWLDQGNFF